MNDIIITELTTKNKEYVLQFDKVREIKAKDEYLIPYLKDESTITYIALDGDKVVGLGFGYELKRMATNSMIYIHSLDVISEYRNKGIGRKIIKQFLSLAKRKNCRNVFLITDKGNIPANKVYQSFTHEQESEKELYIFK